MTRAIERLVVCGVDGVNKRPDGCWYDLVRGALEAALRDRAGGRRRRRGAALSQGAGCAADPAAEARRRCNCRCCRHGCPGRLAETPPRRSDQAVGLRRRPGDGRTDRAARSAPARHPARQHHAPADAVAAGHSARAPRRGRAPPYRARRARTSARPSATPSPPARSRCSTIRASPRCSRPAAAPRCRSSAGSATASSPAWSTAWWSRPTRC